MDPKRKLKGMLARIFSDAEVEDAERDELKAFLAESGLSKDDQREVFADFVATTWKITMADGVVSDREKTRLKEIVRILELDRAVLPSEWTQLLD